MNDKTSEFVPLEGLIAELESLPGIDDDKADRESARQQMEREHALGLATVRKIAQLTQAEVAEKMGVGQTSVSRLEARPDMLLSTMKSYFDAVGAHATITIRIGSVEHRVDLNELVE